MKRKLKAFHIIDTDEVTGEKRSTDIRAFTMKDALARASLLYSSEGYEIEPTSKRAKKIFRL